MIISVTERGVFKRCRQMWDYSSFSRQHLTSRTPPTALSFGTLIHKSHEEWLLHPNDEVTDIVARQAVPVLRELKINYKKMIGVEPDDREFKSFYEQVELAINVMNNYKQFWGASLPEGYTLLQPEQTLLVPIPGTVHHLEATLDGLIADEGGRLWVLERKTFANHPKTENLQWNDQFLTYLWAVQQAFPTAQVGGVLYDGMWKRDGSKHSIEQLFHREWITRSPDELETLERELVQEALDMESPRIYRTIPPFLGCFDCQFVRLCQAEMRHEDSDYIRDTYYTQREKHEWADSAD